MCVCVLLLGFGWFVLIVWIGYAMRGQSRLFILFLGFVWAVWVVCVVLIAIWLDHLDLFSWCFGCLDCSDSFDCSFFWFAGDVFMFLHN